MKVQFDFVPEQTTYGTVHRPVLLLKIRYKTTERVFDFLIDSGADFSLLKPECAKELGLDFESGKKRTIKGICGHGIDCLEKQATFTLTGFDAPFESKVFVSKQLNLTHNLLGRDNFFEHYRVGIDQKQKKIIIER